MEAPLMSEMASLLGYTRDKERESTHEQRYGETKRFVGEAGVVSFARSIAFFGYFDGVEELRALPWTNDAVKHHALWEQVRDSAANVRSPGHPELIGGYAAQFQDGTTHVFHTGVLEEGDVRIAALEKVDVLLPRVDQTFVHTKTGKRIHFNR
jgi:hypothetical protein